MKSLEPMKSIENLQELKNKIYLKKTAKFNQEIFKESLDKLQVQ